MRRSRTLRALRGSPRGAIRIQPLVPVFAERMRAASLPWEGQPFGLALEFAEVEGLICSGPVIEGGHSYWASLTLTDARSGIRSNEDQFARFDHDGRTYWHASSTAPPDRPTDPRAHILQILDECYRGYQDSRWILDAAHLVPRTREKTTGMVPVDAQIVATMRRTIRADHILLDLATFRTLTPTRTRSGVLAQAEYYANYLNLEPNIVWRN